MTETDVAVRESEDQRYIPLAYLKPWTSERTICEMQRMQDTVTLRHIDVDESGFTADPSAIDEVPAEIAQICRARFASLAANDAHDTLWRIANTQAGEWDAELRAGFIQFLIALVFRNPCTVAQIAAGLREVLDAGNRAQRSRYAMRRSDPKTFADYVTKADPQAPLLAATGYLDDAMNTAAVAEAIENMRWARIGVPRSRFSLLTSDNPFDMPLSLTDKNAYIALPLGPRALFIATNNPGLIDSLAKQDHSKIVRMLNMATVTQARDHVWATDESQYAFVTNHFGSAPVKRLLSDRPRQTALAALETRPAR